MYCRPLLRSARSLETLMRFQSLSSERKKSWTFYLRCFGIQSRKFECEGPGELQRYPHPQKKNRSKRMPSRFCANWPQTKPIQKFSNNLKSTCVGRQQVTFALCSEEFELGTSPSSSCFFSRCRSSALPPSMPHRTASLIAMSSLRFRAP